MQVRVFCCHIMQALDLDVEDKNAIPDAAMDADDEFLEIVSQKVNDRLTSKTIHVQNTGPQDCLPEEVMALWTEVCGCVQCSGVEVMLPKACLGECDS